MHHHCRVSSRKCNSRSREKEKFVRLFANFKIHKGTIIFKINVFKSIQKYPGLKKSSVALNFLKNYFKDVRGICKQNSCGRVYFNISPLVFPKIFFWREDETPFFLILMLSQVTSFLKMSLKLLKSSRYEDFLCQY